jgi:hypothetical protein
VQVRKKKEQHTIFLGTKKEWIAHVLEQPIRDKDGYLLYDCIAKDDGGLIYYTRKDYVGARMMDPNRMYKRNICTEEQLQQLTSPPEVIANKDEIHN